ncbi:MAG: hypothetical protein MI757_05560, partial [Pirellulales bacterium]|nr:hypothetical protein [Pirellulales bacterium]
MSTETDVQVTRAVAIELTPMRVVLTDVQSDDALATATIRAASVEFDEPLRLVDSAGADQLVDALRPLVQQFAIGEQPLSVVLSGEYCSTRVVSGDEDAVRRGMQD